MVPEKEKQSLAFCLPCQPVSMSSRQNFTAVSEEALNHQILVELTASYAYMSMASYFGRDGVALAGFKKFFELSSEEVDEIG